MGLADPGVFRPLNVFVQDSILLPDRVKIIKFVDVLPFEVVDLPEADLLMGELGGIVSRVHGEFRNSIKPFFSKCKTVGGAMAIRTNPGNTSRGTSILNFPRIGG